MSEMYHLKFIKC